MRWWWVGCKCCDECFAERMRFQTLRWVLWSLMLVVPIMGLTCVLPLFVMAQKQDAGIIETVLLGVLVFTLIGPFVVVPIALRSFVRRSLPGLFDEEVQTKLRALAGVKNWGTTAGLFFARRLPKNTTPRELRDIADMPLSRLR